jgi:hypothetical protein
MFTDGLANIKNWLFSRISANGQLMEKIPKRVTCRICTSDETYKWDHIDPIVDVIFDSKTDSYIYELVAIDFCCTECQVVMQKLFHQAVIDYWEVTDTLPNKKEQARLENARGWMATEDPEDNYEDEERPVGEDTYHPHSELLEALRSQGRIKTDDDILEEFAQTLQIPANDLKLYYGQAYQYLLNIGEVRFDEEYWERSWNLMCIDNCM